FWRELHIGTEVWVNVFWGNRASRHYSPAELLELVHALTTILLISCFSGVHGTVDTIHDTGSPRCISIEGHTEPQLEILVDLLVPFVAALA
ncbi:MAG TPA: hypothetical protein VIX59_11060, partial [Candidatus Binataceae bacterium]